MSYLAGRGTADITGEAAGCGMLGYGKAEQQSTGIHTRLHARAFAFADDGPDNGPDDGPATDVRRILLVVCELPLMSAGVVRDVLRRLPEGYTASNVMITATHTHCGPGGYFHHELYNSNTGGFREQTYGAIVDGIVEAARAAHADLAPAVLRLAHGELLGASANRSLRAFARNPAADRAHFPHAVDPQTTVLRIERDGLLAGAVNWFATHNTSMTNTNTLISADNKGYAASRWEQDAKSAGLVTAFAQTNAGDMSPNLHLRPGSGPTDDEFENTRIIGSRQYEAALALDGDELTGRLDARLTHVDLSQVTVRPEFTGDGRTHRTSGPVAGASAFAGAWADGPGFKGFRPGRNLLWDTLSQQVIYPLAPGLRDAQSPKGLCLPAGPINRLRPMVQERIPVQLLRIGPLYLIGLPAEVTIVAGLRLRRTVAGIVGADPANVLVAGYSNAYAHYVTTPEEYDAQEYEGGSTLFGRWELPALCQSAAGLAEAMRDGVPANRGTPERLRPPRKRHRRRGSDAPHPGRDFGDVLSFGREGSLVTATFVGAHPGNDLRRGRTYLAVERRCTGGDDGEGDWIRTADDGDWSTTFRWAAAGGSASTVTVTWDVPPDTAPGSYRLRYFGDTASGSFTGATAPFEVL